MLKIPPRIRALIQNVEYNLFIRYTRYPPGFPDFPGKNDRGVHYIDQHVTTCRQIMLALPAARRLTLRPEISLRFLTNGCYPFDGAAIADRIAPYIVPLAKLVENFDITFDDRQERYTGCGLDRTTIRFGDEVTHYLTPCSLASSEYKPSGHAVLVMEIKKRVQSLLLEGKPTINPTCKGDK